MLSEKIGEEELDRRLDELAELARTDDPDSGKQLLRDRLDQRLSDD